MRTAAAVGRFLKGALDDQSLRWPLLLPLALTGGAALYMSWPNEPSWAPVVAFAAAPGLGWLTFRRRGGGWAGLFLALLACAGVGALAGKIRSGLVAAPVLLQEIGPVRIEGIVAELDASERNRRVRIAVRAIEDLTPDQTPRFVRFSYRGEMPLAPGRAVACRAMLSPPPRPVVPGDYEFHRDAWFQQLGAVGFSTGGCQPLPTPPATSADQRVGFWIGALRRGISEHVYKAAGEKGGGMSAAMVAGDRSFITPADSEALRLSGLAHLLSISGVHMVLVGGVVFFAIRLVWPLIEPLALRAPAVRAAALGAIVTCSLYFAISGGEVATQRAYVMALIGFGAKLFDRPALSLRSLAIALAIVVLIQPEAVVTPGFQMSFAASGSLIALYEAWPRLDRPASRGVLSRLRGWIAGALATSAIASAATMPFALYHFDRAAVFSVVANIVSTPVMTLWTTPAAIAAAIASLAGVDEPFLRLMGWSLEVVLGIAHWAVDVSPDVDLPRMNGIGLVWGALAIGVFCLASGRGKVLATAPLAGMLIAWLNAPEPVGYIANDGSVFLKAERGWLELTDWRGENGLNPLIIGDEIAKSPCPGKGSGCTLEMPAGRFDISPGDGAAAAGCPSSAILTFTAIGQPTRANVQPCAYTGQGGAVLEVAGGRFSVRTAQQQSGRAWTQPLFGVRDVRR